LKCFIILPCYNEEKNIAPLIKSIAKTLKKTPYQIIAVNDGSTDNTEKILKKLALKYPIKTLTHPRNMGLAKTLKTGLKHALTECSKEDLIIIMDSDNTHNPKYIPEMIRKTQQYDLVIGSRYIQGGKQLNVPAHRILLSRVINQLLKLILKANIRDFTSGYKCFRAEALQKIFEKFGENFISSSGFEVSLELLYKTLCHGFSASEIAITLNYGFKNGDSKLKVFPTILKYLHFIRNMKTLSQPNA